MENDKADSASENVIYEEIDINFKVTYTDKKKNQVKR